MDVIDSSIKYKLGDLIFVRNTGNCFVNVDKGILYTKVLELFCLYQFRNTILEVVIIIL